MEVAKGSKGAEAYRKAYNSKASPKQQGNEAYNLRRKPEIAEEIKAYQLAIEAEKHRTPAALRSLVIQALTQVIIDPAAKHSTVVAAAKVLGTVTEVAAFTERKEIKTITSSEDARAKIMAELRNIMATTAEDATLIDAESLLGELRPHPSPEAHEGEQESRLHEHTIPPERSQSFPHLDENLSTGETPPSEFGG